MEHLLVPLDFVAWLMGTFVSLLLGCWAIFKYFESQLKRAYERMDENRKSFYTDFVTIKVFEEYRRARQEIIDEKFDSMNNILDTKFDSLFQKFDDIKDEIKNIKFNKNDHQ